MKSNIQTDTHNGEHRRGPIPANVHFESESERAESLRARRDSLPADSTARAIVVTR